MTSKSLPINTLAIIAKYQNFSVGGATCSIPYYNNKRIGARASLRAQIGKGSPENIHDEAAQVAALKKVNLLALDSMSLKKFLVDNNIGIDCSGLVYHILEPKNLTFPFQKGLLGKLRSSLRKAENAGVSTFAHESNSKSISLTFVQPGDIITMVGGEDNNDRDHILAVHQVDYKDGEPALIYYTHSVAWPTDGEYGHGVRQGQIKITNPDKQITDQEWLEAGKTGPENYTFTRAQKSTTSLRRLRFL